MATVSMRKYMCPTSVGTQECMKVHHLHRGPVHFHTAVLSLVLKLLHPFQNDELKRTAFEGFCKLLVTGVVYSPSLLKSVIIKGFTPIRG